MSVIGVVIPAFNAERFIGQAIASVLEQTYGDVDCVVVDDGSTDGTAAVVAGFGARVRLLSQANRGVAAARNHGAARTEGGLIAFLDADDRWRPERLQRGVDFLRARPAFEAVVCGTQVVDDALRPLRLVTHDANVTAQDMLLCRAAVVSTGSNLLITRECFDAVGGFDETLSTSADWAMTFRLVTRGSLGAIAEPLVEYRRHDANMSSSVEAMERDMLRTFDDVFNGPGADPALRPLRRRALANLHRVIAGSYLVAGQRARFVRHAARSVAGHPSTVPYFLAMPARRRRRRRGQSRQPSSQHRVRVAHVISDAGPHPYFALIGDHADRESFDVRLATVGPRGDLHHEAERMGLPAIALDARGRIHYPRAVVTLARYLRRERIDVVQAHLLEGAMVGLLAARLARTPVAVLTGHHSQELAFYERALLTFVDRLCAGPLCDLIIAPSNQMRDTFVACHRVAPDKVAVVHHGFELEWLHPARGDRNRLRDELGLQERVVVGSIGRLHWIKNQAALVRAFAELAPRHPDATLLIVGTGDPVELEQLGRSLGIEARLRVIARRDDVRDVLAALDVLVHPALAESFAMVLIEAMAMARPVVSTPVGIAPEVIRDGDTGILAGDGRPASLAAALERMFELRGDWGRIGEAARRRAESFPASAMVTAYEDCYRASLASARRRGRRRVGGAARALR